MDPALLGTRNVLSAAVKSKATVRRVVLTSSFAGGARTQTLRPQPGAVCVRTGWLRLGTGRALSDALMSTALQMASSCWCLVASSTSVPGHVGLL